MRLRIALCFAALVLGAIAPSAVITGGNLPGSPLGRSEMARLRGSTVNVGLCSMTCPLYQTLSDNGTPAQWLCQGVVDGVHCNLCSKSGNNYTWPSQTTGTTGWCPGQWYTQGATQDCGTVSVLNQAHCQGGACTLDQGGGYTTTGCNQPQAAVKQAGH